MEEEKRETNILDKLKEETDKSMKRVLEQGVQTNNVDFLYKMIDIKKDIAEIEKEEEDMMYGNYGRGSYRAGGSGGSSGRSSGGSYGEYGEGGSYGRRGVPGSGRGRYRGGRGSGRYRGEEMMDEMMYHYGNYSEGSSYGAEGEAMESLSNLMESAYEYFKELKENANSPDEIKMMEHYFKKMGQM